MKEKKQESDDPIKDLLDDIELNNDALKEAVQKSESSKGEGEEGSNVEALKNVLEATQKNIQRALEVLGGKGADVLAFRTRLSKIPLDVSPEETDRITEGVFNGEAMIGSDGKEYSIPPNYASKSKLVEGDILKLTITKNGSFIYKQIGPIEREKLKAVLIQDEITGDWYAVSDSRRWKLLTASVTYFRGQPGDEIVILIPKNSKSLWAAVENIIKQ